MVTEPKPDVQFIPLILSPEAEGRKAQIEPSDQVVDTPTFLLKKHSLSPPIPITQICACKKQLLHLLNLSLLLSVIVLVSVSVSVSIQFLMH
ncbi:hypothetical protein BA171_04300 [Candidatus Hamiltonella defensa (Bemisia tabaci)]|uniref:Uncharacterized protein n=1 Tax=Candidatus Hamiltonella defensa (Bemisia tabaci) TaxID=672795 RepID=A0A249DYY6_9ENTR|nr:hypothetical protein BA171_04300 [Candidatus Hamiltonella defensa (Bemisia tabaci)]